MGVTADRAILGEFLLVPLGWIHRNDDLLATHVAEVNGIFDRNTLGSARL
jgi:hypothetical protein